MKTSAIDAKCATSAASAGKPMSTLTSWRKIAVRSQRMCCAMRHGSSIGLAIVASVVIGGRIE